LFQGNHRRSRGIVVVGEHRCSRGIVVGEHRCSRGIVVPGELSVLGNIIVPGGSLSQRIVVLAGSQSTRWNTNPGPWYRVTDERIEKLLETCNATGNKISVTQAQRFGIHCTSQADG
jgi:hypothetical protein